MIAWIQSHPEGVLIAIALTAFIESFALIGVVVPGVVMLFSLAAVASNLGIPVMWVLAAAALGATAGDLGSFYLGYRLRHRLYQHSWFKRHADWLSQGIWFFRRWGWLSVVIGRFVGPIRPVVPLIAGSLSMPAKVFISVNLVTVLFWAPTYMLPGYLAGEASSYLATQSLAMRTLSLLLVSALSTLIALVATYHHLHPEHPRMARWVPALQSLPTRFPFAALLLLIAASTGFAATLLSRPWGLDALLAGQVGAWRASAFDPVAIVLTFLGDPATLILTGLMIILWLVLGGQHRLGAVLLISLVLLTTGIPLLKSAFDVARPGWTALPLNSQAFPSGHAAGAALFFGMLAGFVNQRRPTMSRWHLYLPAGVTILVIALSRVWLGVHWLSDVIAGVCLGLLLAALAQATHRLTGRSLADFRNSLTLWLLILLTLASYLIIAWPLGSVTYQLG
ncbi:bifunctional DedA family/phosphatase PAP2 family protein [Saccharospirillum impatiens]|uniref:bifunctional DedA family/phosphatase PAP2 family protein n=1 Tax=Saccharospirillum impatiens TaxID=169438 RepID=UPI0004275582|nr:bifunctional DedA family/phosphatase PAP2 family protein [Saccharospirillum impatiens]